MNAEQLNAIKERAEKATSCPWLALYEGTNAEIYSTKTAEDVCEITAKDEYHAENAEFIAHAREDVPSLVAEVERLRDVLESAGGMFSIGEGGKAMDYICKGLGVDWTYFDEGDSDD